MAEVTDGRQRTSLLAPSFAGHWMRDLSADVQACASLIGLG